MSDTRETAARVAVEIAELVGFDPTVQNAAGRRVEDIVDEALRNERERVITRFMSIVKDIKGPNVPRVDLYEAMLCAGREILNPAIRNPKESEGDPGIQNS